MTTADRPRAVGPMPVLNTVWRLLTFRLTGDEYRYLDGRHLAFGLLATWLAGIGRNWDNPEATLFQYLGGSSLVYVFVLALFLWMLVGPLRPEDWSYRGVLTFVTLTAPPALLYAIPVELFTSVDTARLLNLGFLAVVAVWRVALYVHYLKHLAGFEWWPRLVATLFPLDLAICVLAFLDAARKVLETMGGLDEGPSTTVERIVAFLVSLSFYLFLPAITAYIATVTARSRR